MKKFVSIFTLLCFLVTSEAGNYFACAQAISLPAPGTMVDLSPAFEPVLIKGLKVHPENPFLFDFIIDSGNSRLTVDNPRLKQESNKLIKYFLAAMTVPEKDLWVNLSPYEKGRMIAPNLGQTEMGRDMLAEDYILKQLTASLMYPEKNLGKTFWDEVYTKAQQLYGTTQIPVNTFNKVWIVANKADVFERGNVAYVIGAHLKVMLEEDYWALQKHSIASSLAPRNDTYSIGANIIRKIILPQIEKEVNNGRNFAPLRQIFYSMILASWYKMALKDAILTQIYGNKSKVKVGVNQPDVKANDEIFLRYLRAYKKGVFNYIKEESFLDPGSESKKQGIFPRKYFSGGLEIFPDGDATKVIHIFKGRSPPQADWKHGDLAMVSGPVEIQKDAAMQGQKFTDPSKALKYLLSNGDEISGQSFLAKMRTLEQGGHLPEKSVEFFFKANALDHLGIKNIEDLRRVIPDAPKGKLSEALVFRYLLTEGRKPAEATWNDYVQLLDIAYELYAPVAGQGLERAASALDHLADKLLSRSIESIEDLKQVIPEVPKGRLNEGMVLRHLLTEGKKPAAVTWNDYVKLLDIAYASYAPVAGQELERAASALDNFGKEAAAHKRADSYMGRFGDKLIELLDRHFESIENGQRPTKESITLYFLNLVLDDKLPKGLQGPKRVVNGQIQQGLAPNSFLVYFPRLAEKIFAPQLEQWQKAHDEAMAVDGGIDLSHSRMNVSKEDRGVSMQFDHAMLERIKREGFDGLKFHIQSIVPITNLPLLLGLEAN